LKGLEPKRTLLVGTQTIRSDESGNVTLLPICAAVLSRGVEQMWVAAHNLPPSCSPLLH
jgi:hypothetical protein